LGYLTLTVLTVFLPVLLGRLASDSFPSALDLTITTFFIYLGALFLGLISGVIGYFRSNYQATRTVFLLFAFLCGVTLLLLFTL
jgi:hypothetical protein